MENDQNVKTCGYCVVRKPEYYFNMSGEELGLPRQPLIVDGKIYSGILRALWRDVSVPYYEGTLPPEIKHLYQEICDTEFNSRYGHGLKLSKDISIVRQLLAYANRQGDYNEIIAIFSPLLAGVTGTISLEQLDIEWLGYDIAGWGEGSLLEEGFFVAPSAFASVRDSINANGLLTNADRLEDLVVAYKNAEKVNNIEHFPSGGPIVAYEVVRINN